jgi:hypothetical protein
MIDHPVFLYVLFGACLGVITGICVSYMRYRYLWHNDVINRQEEIGSYCPVCHTKNTHVVIVKRLCESCGRVIVTTACMR